MERSRRSSSEGPTVAHRARLFPFWIVVRPDDLPPVGLATKASRYAAAFVSSECALAYLHRQRDSKSELRLVCRATFGDLAARLRKFGVLGLCFEPDPLGRGDTITLAQMDRFLTAPSRPPRERNPVHRDSAKMRPAAYRQPSKEIASAGRRGITVSMARGKASTRKKRNCGD
jgi:hypothetical protein